MNEYHENGTPAMNYTRFPALRNNHNKIAIVDGDHNVTYDQLHHHADRLASGLLNTGRDLDEERVAMLLPAGAGYVIALHGIWRAGGIAVPLSHSSTKLEFEHALSNAKVTRLIVNNSVPETLNGVCQQLNVEVLTLEHLTSSKKTVLPEVCDDRRALIIFTSGTTNKPKGVVTTHAAIAASILSLLQAWEWREADVIPLFLPLHHVHGIINVLSCALWCGATIHTMPHFNLDMLCQQVADHTYTIFMAVPTIYVKLIDHLGSIEPSQAKAIAEGFGRMRLNVSGSAACPVIVFEKWQTLTNQILLERYGMTEIGMAISNPYRGTRKAGFVGQALPGVTVALFDDNNQPVESDGVAGEIRIKGRNVFKEYWNNPKATKESFVDGWFCTGDIAVVEEGAYRIMGRSSIDIIKSGGYKLSALEIEGFLLTHPSIQEVAVVGIEDDTWGERVAAIVVLKTATTLDLPALKNWCRNNISAYKIPKQLRIVDALPRNAMGKVVKPSLKTLF